MADLAFGEQSKLTPLVPAMLSNVQRMFVSRVAPGYKILSRLIKAATPEKVTQGAQLHYNRSYARVEMRLNRGLDIGKPGIWKLAMEKERRRLSRLEETNGGSDSSFYNGGKGDKCHATQRPDLPLARTFTLHVKAADV